MGMWVYENCKVANQILTAAHCVENLKKDAVIKVSCGYRGFDKEKLISQKTKSGNTVFLAGVKFQEEAIGISYSIHPNRPKDENNFDIAIITLNHSLAVKPMVIVNPRLINCDVPDIQPPHRVR